jgi:hypothetical protein
MNTEQVAEAFVAGRSGKCHNAATDGTEYRLHGHRIAHKIVGGIELDWCGYHTQTTARHMNAVLRAFGLSDRVSAAAASRSDQSVVRIDL